MKLKIHTTTFYIFFCLLTFNVSGQILPTGSSTVGSTVTYRVMDDGGGTTGYDTYSWTADNGNVGSTWKTGTGNVTYYASITWNGSGSNVIRFYDNYDVELASGTISVSCPAVSVPSATITGGASLCAPRTFSYSQSPPTGVSWYWVTSDGGQETAASSAGSVLINSPVAGL